MHAMRKRGVRAGALQGATMLIIYTHYSLDDFDDGELEDGKGDSSFRKSFNYGTLAYANSTGRSFYSNKNYEDWIYYSNHKLDVSYLHVKDLVASIGYRRAWALSRIQNGGRLAVAAQHSMFIL
uniref:Uncharacterized protein n=1 Tax=Nelumbo nucifera TaxID=4432 RepID=A0A822XGH6_NELNU|nr:TPA_asm: hypothetical protein HUJ06_019582 [Nelumbo nucifera]